MDISVDLQIACPADSVPTEKEIRSWLERACQAGRPNHPGRRDVSVRIVDEQEIRRLNRQYRQQDEATNVLAFPAGDPEEWDGLPGGMVRTLGDLVICAAVVECEAREQGKNPASHWAHLLVHGMLHLLGYDHDSSSQAAEMETMEKQILADRGIEDPYQAG